MGECLVGFCHTVCVFFLLECAAFSFACSDYFTRQFVGHALPVSFPAKADQPFYAQGNFTVSTHFCRNLKSSPSDSTASHFNSRRYIVQCPSPDFVSVIVCLF